MRVAVLLLLLPSPSHAQTREGVVDMFARLEQLRDLRGFQPKHILDVGANRGTWALRARLTWPKADIFMIEANEQQGPNLIKCGIPFMFAVLGDSQRKTKMNFGEMKGAHDTGSSIFRQTTHVSAFSEKLVTMRTLDEVLNSTGRGEHEFELLKLDVQGAELMVLRGARKTLAKVQAILLEVSVVLYNEGAPLWLQVQTELAGLGFHVYDVLELHYLPPTSMLVQVDLLVVHERSRLWEKRLTGYPRPYPWSLDVSASSGTRGRHGREHGQRHNSSSNHDSWQLRRSIIIIIIIIIIIAATATLLGRFANLMPWTRQ